MKFLVVVQRKQSRAADFAAALDPRRGYEPASVYVVGLDEAKALELALVDGRMEAQEMDAKTLAAFPWAEAIGTEEKQGDLPRLVELADRRVIELSKGDRR